MKYAMALAPQLDMVRIGSREVCLRVYGKIYFYAVHMELNARQTSYGSEMDFLAAWLDMNKGRKLP